MKKKPAKKAAPKRGRPNSYTKAVGEAICARISDGETLRAICRDAAMPAWRTVYGWMAANDDFSARIARAREMGFDAIAQQTMEIADTPLEGVETTIKPDGTVEERRGDMLGHRKLQIETRLKLLAKWSPKKYGDKLALGGADDLPPMQMASAMTDDQLMAIAAGRAAAKP